jgi:hypothetical protein
VPGRAGKSAPTRPSPVAVHNARHMNRPALGVWIVLRHLAVNITEGCGATMVA